MNAFSESMLPTITDEQMREGLGMTRVYTLMILKKGPNFSMPGVSAIIWEHGRRNFALRAAGLLPIVCPINDGSGLTGIGIFDATPAEVEQIYAADPGVQAGVFTFEVHAVRGFPGASLPA